MPTRCVEAQRARRIATHLRCAVLLGSLLLELIAEELQVKHEDAGRARLAHAVGAQFLRIVVDVTRAELGLFGAVNGVRPEERCEEAAGSAKKPLKHGVGWVSVCVSTHIAAPSRARGKARHGLRSPPLDAYKVFMGNRSTSTAADARVEAARSPATSSLSLTECGLAHMPAQVYELAHLTSLNVSRNDLTALTDDLMHLSALQSLFGNTNRIARLPDTLVLPQLTT